MTPSAGRIVLYTDAALIDHNAGRLAAPAIVTGVADDELTVNLTVFADGGRVSPAQAVPHRSIAGDGEPSWDWPDRVDEDHNDDVAGDGETTAGTTEVPSFP